MTTATRTNHTTKNAEYMDASAQTLTIKITASEAEEQANARLIASAPELLEALRMFLLAVEGPACVTALAVDGSNAWPQINEAASAARAAILKTTEPQS